MRMTRGWMPVLLAAGLLAGQWLAAVHNADHVLSPAGAHACLVCAQSAPDDSGLAPVAPALVLDPGRVPRALPSIARGAASTHLSNLIRGPPSPTA